MASPGREPPRRTTTRAASARLARVLRPSGTVTIADFEAGHDDAREVDRLTLLPTPALFVQTRRPR